jgi:large subunit ribosomal protein L14e
MDDRLQVGCVVYSKKGRDSGKYYVVVQSTEQFVWICDGDVRRLANPKKKNIKHVKPNGVVLETIAQKLSEKKKVFDSELRSALRAFNEDGGNECPETM